MIEKNLKFYRLRSGLSKKDLAERCGLSAMAITNYEAGSRKPDVDILRRLAVALGVSLPDLMRRRNVGLSFIHGEFRKTARLSQAKQELVRECVEDYIGRLYDTVEILGGDVLPEAPVCGVLPITGGIEEDAAALRRALDIEPVGPVHDLVGTLENRGVLVVRLDGLDECFSGINGFVNGRPYIAFNADMSPERNRSTIAHELAHLMFCWPEDLVGKAQEDRATAISGAFLFPASDVVRELGLHRHSIAGDMVAVAKEYGVSMMLLAVRAKLSGVIGESAYKRFCISASKIGWRKNEPRRIVAETPRLLHQLVMRAVCEEEISIQRASELLDCDYESVENECKLIGD